MRVRLKELLKFKLNFSLTCLLFTTLLSTGISFASMDYYPTEFKKYINSNSINSSQLKNKLIQLLHDAHVSRPGQNDILVNSCSNMTQTTSGRCYRQKVLSYHNVRKFLFGRLYLNRSSSQARVLDVYCQKSYGISSGVGIDKIPDAKNLNCEHTWPQSKFSSRYSSEMQKTDLHHLFPTDSKANSIRGSHLFGNVTIETHQGLCSNSKIGHIKNSTRLFFEPPRNHKGNVARALFYFSMRYNIKINNQEEVFLRQWHELDPVDSDEIEKNNLIENIQHNRNPFIDYPSLVKNISDF